LRELNDKLDAALRLLHDKKSERSRRAQKMPSVQKALGTKVSKEAASEKRKENQEALALHAVDAGEQEHEVSAEAQHCTHCGDHADFQPVGAGKATELFDYVPGYFRRSRHVVHTVACTCGQTIVSAEGPQRVTPGSKYGPGLGAWLIVHKCLLSMPVYRVEKLLRGHGIPIGRSTLNEVLHRTADKLQPIYEVLVRQVRAAQVVLADETPLKLMSHDKQGYIWVFLGNGAVVYRFADGRGAVTPLQVLGGTEGTLLTDAYAGYKPLTAQGGRVAAACLAHLRRKFHESLPTAPEAQAALDFILQVYRVEHEALAAGVSGTDAHLRLRQKRAGPAMGHLKKWMRQQMKVTAPKSPLGRAIAHALAQWRAAVRFLYDASLPVDNNASERALRVVALGRKNFYGAGSKEGGRVLAILYSLVTTCEAANVNPFAYLRDVLVRVETEEPEALTPANWAEAHG
jgi:transposase